MNKIITVLVIYYIITICATSAIAHKNNKNKRVYKIKCVLKDGHIDKMYCPAHWLDQYKTLYTYIYKNPEIMIYGNDESRSGWFSKEDLKNTTELIINRAELPISATMLRQYMVEDNRKAWMELVNPKLHKMYDELRNELMTVEFYQKLKKRR